MVGSDIVETGVSLNVRRHLLQEVTSPPGVAGVGMPAPLPVGAGVGAAHGEGGLCAAH